MTATNGDWGTLFWQRLPTDRTGDFSGDAGHNTWNHATVASGMAAFTTMQDNNCHISSQLRSIVIESSHSFAIPTSMDVTKEYSMQENKRRTDHGEPQRSVESAIAEALKKSGYHALRRLECEFDGTLFTLRGRVSTYYEKQVAQQIVLSHIGSRTCFDNQLEVVTNRQHENRRFDNLEQATSDATAPVAMLTLPLVADVTQS